MTSDTYVTRTRWARFFMWVEVVNTIYSEYAAGIYIMTMNIIRAGANFVGWLMRSSLGLAMPTLSPHQTLPETRYADGQHTNKWRPVLIRWCGRWRDFSILMFDAAKKQMMPFYYWCYMLRQGRAHFRIVYHHHHGLLTCFLASCRHPMLPRRQPKSPRANTSQLERRGLFSKRDDDYRRRVTIRLRLIHIYDISGLRKLEYWWSINI